MRHRGHEFGSSSTGEAPIGTPAAGWRDILLRVCRGIIDDRILLVAAGFTFDALLAIFPGIAALLGSPEARIVGTVDAA